MFATLLGALPEPPLTDAGGERGDAHARLDALVARAVQAQEEAGLEPITDGRLRWPGLASALGGLDGLEASTGGAMLRATALPAWTHPLTVDAWQFAATLTARAVKQALPGPYTLAREMSAGAGRDGAATQLIDRTALTQALATALRREVLALAEAGCPMVEIEERDAHLIGDDPAERRLFREAHLALMDGIAGTHLSLALIGGNADAAGIDTILAAPYQSLAVDLIDGPDNWRLVRGAPVDRGIVCGAMSGRPGSDDGPELLLWAAGYAASAGGRGRDRVGLATAGSLAGLSWGEAERKIRRLGEASRLGSLPAAEAAAHLDPRAIDIRSAAAGRFVPPRAAPPPRPPRPSRPPRGMSRS